MIHPTVLVTISHYCHYYFKNENKTDQTKESGSVVSYDPFRMPFSLQRPLSISKMTFHSGPRQSF